jgi:hypothetical protein
MMQYTQLFIYPATSLNFTTETDPCFKVTGFEPENNLPNTSITGQFADLICRKHRGSSHGSFNCRDQKCKMRQNPGHNLGFCVEK